MWIQKFAQKAIVYNDQKEVLMIRYGSGKFMGEKISGKWAIPGGKLEAGETLNDSLRKEVLEETAVNCDPGMVIALWNWEYKKNQDTVQINAVSRACKYISGKPGGKKQEKESEILGCEWTPLKKVLKLDLVFDERPSLEKFVKNFDFYTKDNE